MVGEEGKGIGSDMRGGRKCETEKGRGREEVIWGRDEKWKSENGIGRE